MLALELHLAQLDVRDFEKIVVQCLQRVVTIVDLDLQQVFHQVEQAAEATASSVHVLFDLTLLNVLHHLRVSLALKWHLAVHKQMDQNSYGPEVTLGIDDILVGLELTIDALWSHEVNRRNLV